MARTSDTREKTRELAQKLFDEGIAPSSRRILELLGNKGSLSTITDELGRWERARLGQTENPLDVLNEGSRKVPLPEESALGPVITLLKEQSEFLRDNNVSLLEELEAIRDEMAQLRATHAEQLAIAYSRYESVQKYALLQVDEARQTTGALRERVKAVTSELDTREMANSGKLQSVREENARLRGLLEAYSQFNGDSLAK